jgi:YbbR domain-containing protein
MRAALPRLPFHVDVGRGAFALLLAVLLYFVALTETNPAENNQLPFTVPVQVVNLPSGLVNTTPPTEVKLWVQAQRNVFTRLSRTSFTAQVNAAGARAGDNAGLPVTVTTTDPDVRDVQPEPKTVNVQLEEVREQTLPVRINIIGDVQKGYQRGEPHWDPPTVTVAGASSLVSRAAEAVVDVNVDRVTVGVNGVFTPRIVDDRGNELRDPGLRVQPPAVTVTMPITQQTGYKEVGVHVVTTGNPAPGYILKPLSVTPATATLVGDPADLEAANFVDTQPIDISGISTTIVRSAPLSPPQRTLLLQPGQAVTVTIQVTPLTVSQTISVPPSIVNMSPNVQLVRPLGPIAVTISGPAPALATLALNPSDFRVVVDLGNKGPGRFDADVVVQRVPAGLTIDDFTPKKIQVDLRDVPQPTPTPAPQA